MASTTSAEAAEGALERGGAWVGKVVGQGERREGG